MPPPPITLKVFIASSSELADERQRVVEVCKHLSIEDPILAGRVQLLPVRWDHPEAPTPMEATRTAQDSVIDQIGRPSECDLVVGIVWSRLGEPIVSDAYRKEDGSYLTGTEWELEDAASGQKASTGGRPEIYLFMRTGRPPLVPEAGESYEEAGAQADARYTRLTDFLDDWRHRYGSRPTEFASPAAFEGKLRGVLRTRVTQLLSNRQLEDQPPDTEQPAQEPQLAQWHSSPYRGLETFQVDDAPIFFGRTRETHDLLSRLQNSNVRFLLVAGASGTGKSSLVGAGVLPHLASVDMPDGERWQCFRFTPAGLPGRQGQSDPFVALAAELRAPLKFSASVTVLAERCQNEEGFLQEQLQAATTSLPGDAEWLLFIDQFEELFTRVVDQGVRDDFAASLASITTLPRLRVLATMRSEFLHPFTHDRVLNGLIAEPGATYTISTPSRGALYDMIVQPARLAGVEVHPELALRILDDAGAISADATFEQERADGKSRSIRAHKEPTSRQQGAPVALPLVEFTLRRLYDRHSDRKTLTVDMYDEIGGITGAIEQCLRDTVGMPDQNQNIDAETRDRIDREWEQRFARLFEYLVDVNETEVATRRSASITAVKKAPDAWKIAQDLLEARLLVSHERTLEVAHEALFTAWQSLSRWIERRKVALREWWNMEFAAAEWNRKGRPDYLTWPFERLRSFRSETAALGRIPTRLQKVFLRSEVERLLEELEHIDTPHERRADIGTRLNSLNDPRPGLRIRSDGTPDVSQQEYWCKVQGGKVEVVRYGKVFKFSVQPFLIARYPVTREQFRAFQAAEDGYRNPNWWEAEWERRKSRTLPEEGGNRPATRVNWIDATVFCRWLSSRLGYEVFLPTEWEWGMAARNGNPDWKFPWTGTWEHWDARRANTSRSGLNRTTAVGMYPIGASPVGALDMAGNVWEWCRNDGFEVRALTDVHHPTLGVMRGGSWASGLAQCSCDSRNVLSARSRGSGYGFRLACSSHVF